MSTVADRAALKADLSSPTSPGRYVAVDSRKRGIIDCTSLYRDLCRSLRYSRMLKSPGMLGRFD